MPIDVIVQGGAIARVIPACPCGSSEPRFPFSFTVDGKVIDTLDCNSCGSAEVV